MIIMMSFVFIFDQFCVHCNIVSMYHVWWAMERKASLATQFCVVFKFLIFCLPTSNLFNNNDLLEKANWARNIWLLKCTCSGSSCGAPATAMFQVRAAVHLVGLLQRRCSKCVQRFILWGSCNGDVPSACSGSSCGAPATAMFPVRAAVHLVGLLQRRCSQCVQRFILQCGKLPASLMGINRGRTHIQIKWAILCLSGTHGHRTWTEKTTWLCFFFKI